MSWFHTITNYYSLTLPLFSIPLRSSFRRDYTNTFAWFSPWSPISFSLLLRLCPVSTFPSFISLIIQLQSSQKHQFSILYMHTFCLPFRFIYTLSVVSVMIR
ncbi:hypothetical protein [Phaffia rhodozyma]|uniref:Uncharacterized protein n=1 Tax=Phaffia rhodozyma TaxID=264483 RepID=A0A0F7STM1_PHARH|nr:hypothetical protein [Phaffia rhodozyma]